MNTLFEVFLYIGVCTMKRYLMRSMGAIMVLLTTPAIPPEMKLLNALDKDFPGSSCPCINNN